jgi:hypothetical protein
MVAAPSMTSKVNDYDINALMAFTLEQLRFWPIGWIFMTKFLKK